MKICKCFMKGTCKRSGILVIQYISWIQYLLCDFSFLELYSLLKGKQQHQYSTNQFHIPVKGTYFLCSFPTCVTCHRDKGTRSQWTYSGCNLVTIVRWQMGPGDLARLGSGSGRHVSSCNTCAGRYVLELCDSFVKNLGSVSLIECRWKIKLPESTKMKIYL